MGQFPHMRLRRRRMKAFSRALFQETHIHPESLIYPLFVIEGQGIDMAAPKLPLARRLSVDRLGAHLAPLVEAGLQAVALFPVIADVHKSERPLLALDNQNIMCRAIVEIKRLFPHLGIMSDVALDPYTADGHDGIVGSDGVVDNDETLDWLAKQSVLLADAGSDMLGPSAMMDGCVARMRDALDKHGHIYTQIIAYAAKFASSLYGPFRGAVGASTMLSDGNKKANYQLASTNAREAMLECEADLMEGADAIIIKPAMAYLDIIRQSRDAFDAPIVAYHVSGECMMIYLAAQAGLLHLDDAIVESTLSMKRAGADVIITYFVPHLLGVAYGECTDYS